MAYAGLNDGVFSNSPCLIFCELRYFDDGKKYKQHTTRAIRNKEPAAGATQALLRIAPCCAQLYKTYDTNRALRQGYKFR